MKNKLIILILLIAGPIFANADLTGYFYIGALKPTFIPGCTLWVDAADPSTVSLRPGTDYVAQWSDKSGNNNHFIQSSEANQPIYSFQEINNKNAVSFDKDNDNKMLSSLTFPKGNYSVFIVFKTTQANSVILSRDQGGYNDVDTLFGLSTQSVIAVDPGKIALERQAPPTTAAGIETSNTYNDDNPHMAIFVIDGTDSYLYTETESISAASAISGCFSGLTIYLGVGLSGSSNYYDGYLCEVLIYDRALTTVDREQVERYLANKWGI